MGCSFSVTVKTEVSFGLQFLGLTENDLNEHCFMSVIILAISLIA